MRQLLASGEGQSEPCHHIQVWLMKVPLILTFNAFIYTYKRTYINEPLSDPETSRTEDKREKIGWMAVKWRRNTCTAALMYWQSNWQEQGCCCCCLRCSSGSRSSTSLFGKTCSWRSWGYLDILLGAPRLVVFRILTQWKGSPVFFCWIWGQWRREFRDEIPHFLVVSPILDMTPVSSFPHSQYLRFPLWFLCIILAFGGRLKTWHVTLSKPLSSRFCSHHMRFHGASQTIKQFVRFFNLFQATDP